MHAIDSTGPPPRSPVGELLAAYHQLLDTIGELPWAPMVLSRYRGHGLSRLGRRLPRPRWLLRFFVVRHIDRVLATLDRRYGALAALGRASDGERRDRAAVREFRQSLPPTRVRTYLSLLVVATVVVARTVVDLAAGPAAGPDQQDPTGDAGLRSVRDMIGALTAGLSADITSVDRAVTALLNGGYRSAALAMLVLLLSSYVVLRPFVPAFRLKRMLFNLTLRSGEPPGPAVARWSVFEATGIYERERRVLDQLGGRAPRELPFDLVVPALAMLVPLTYGGLFLGAGAGGAEAELRSTFLSTGALLVAAALLRLGWLYRAWRRRQPGRSGPYPPYEVGIRGGPATAKVAPPFGSRLLLIGAVFLLLAVSDGTGIGASLRAAFVATWMLSTPATFLSWRRIDRELAALDDSYGVPTSGRHPVLRRLLTVGGSLTVLPRLVRTSGRIRDAQARARLPGTVRPAWVLVPGLAVHPLLVAYLQHEMNKVWAVEGAPLDPVPGAMTPWSHSGATGGGAEVMAVR